MSDIRAWLEELGLGQYGEVFEENEIDLDLARDLTDDSLEKIGVSVAGHRIRIMRAVGELVAVTAKAPGSQQAAAPTTSASEAERRQLTVMFCDLVGSTALSEKLDPEDLRALMAAYRKVTGDIVERYEGHIAQYLGDGVMAYFGWPRAHEDDAERAVRAGLDIIDAVKAVDAVNRLQLRIGIATGPVVVGEGSDDDAEANKLAVGETPNLAARLQGLAGPDEVIIGPGTRQLVGGAFDIDDLGARNLKGVLEPVPAWRVKGASAAEGRFEARAAGGLTPFVGREAEIQLLLDRWHQAKEGEGQVALLEGEPGIGKSRITQVLRERLADEPHIRLRYQCSPYYANSAFYPVIEQIERAAGFAREDAPDQKLDKLEKTLARGAGSLAEVAPLIGAMLSLPVERYPKIDLSPQRQKEKTIEALADLVVGLAGHDPVLMILEDAHWIDPTTLEVFSSIIDRIQDHAVLLVITYRPEFEPPWSSYGHVTFHTLNRFSRKLGAAMVANVTGGKSLPDDVLDQIVAKTDGVPLFVEELTKTVMETGLLKDAGDHYDLDGPLPPLAIPSTLRDSLMARLDRLSPVKEVAQIGACIGREFSYELLVAVSPLRENELQDVLQQLVNSELIFRRGAAPNASYSFKHALVQDAAYESLLRSKRRQLHGSIAKVLENRDAKAHDVPPELLGHHFAAAGMVDRAIPYYIMAGHLALAGMALPEAVSHLHDGLRLVSELKEDPERDRLELDVRAALGTAYMALLGWPAAEVEDTLGPAHVLCQKAGASAHQFTVLWGLWLHHACQCRFGESIDLFKEMISAGRAADDSGLEITGLMSACLTYFWMGDFVHAAEYRDHVLDLYDFDQHGQLVIQTNHDPKTTVLGWDTQMQWLLGYPDRALESEQEMAALARQLGHAFDSIFTMTVGAAFYGMRREPTELLKRIDQAIEMAVEHGMPLIVNIIGPLWRTPARIQSGEPERCLAEGEPALAGWIALGGKLVTPYFMTAVADALKHCGRFEEALGTIDEALELAETTGQGVYLAELYRMKGEILAGGAIERGDPGSYFRKAIDVAREQGAKGWELRAATSLAGLWQGQGKIEEARDLLAPVYDWFTEGFDTPDLTEAKALLDELK